MQGNAIVHHLRIYIKKSFPLPSPASTNVLWIRNCCPADTACALTRRQHFSAWNDVMAAILK